MMRFLLLRSSSLLSVTLLGFACASEHDSKVATSAPRGPSAASDRTAPVPESQRLAADVRWLADDARAGRRAGTPGEQETTDWIAARFGELGLEPLGTEGYQQPFPVPLPARDGG